MYQRSELFFTGHNGAKLFMQKWSAQNAVGTILITHGHGEHSDCYHRLISEFDSTQWNFIGWDLRGHGKSAGARGYAVDFSEYIQDYDIFIKNCLGFSDVNTKPVILLGHSMGGLIQTSALIDKKYPQTYPNIKAQVLSSPLFGVAFEVPKWKDQGANFINSFLPKLTLGNDVNNEQLTRDPAVIREYESDTYRHHRMSPGVYLGMKREFLTVLEQASKITLPTYMHISDHDPVVSSQAALKMFDGFSSEKKGLNIVQGGKHELYNDTIRKDVIADVIHFAEQYK